MVNWLKGLFFSALGLMITDAWVPVAWAGDRHYPARHCEIFIDKVNLTMNSHGAKDLYLYIKTLNFRLDGPIEEVAFRAREASRAGTVWTTIRLRPFLGSHDYHEIRLDLGSDFSPRMYEGAFYVKTTHGTHYWLNTAEGRNFVFNWATHHTVMRQKNSFDYNDLRLEAAIPTQRESMRYFNPDRCY